jgi:hypothetical protein
VVKPLAPLDIDTVLAELPARCRVKLGESPFELCAKIEQSIAEFGSEQNTPTPEEGFALLAAIAPEGLQPSSSTESSPASPDSIPEDSHTDSNGCRGSAVAGPYNNRSSVSRNGLEFFLGRPAKPFRSLGAYTSVIKSRQPARFDDTFWRIAVVSGE